MRSSGVSPGTTRTAPSASSSPRHRAPPPRPAPHARCRAAAPARPERPQPGHRQARGDLLTSRPDDDSGAGGAQRERGGEHVAEHRPAAELVEHLRAASTSSGCPRPLPARSRRQGRLRTRADCTETGGPRPADLPLLRQDSNLVQVSQSHRCCRYTTQDCTRTRCHEQTNGRTGPGTTVITDTVGSTPGGRSSLRRMTGGYQL